MSKSNIFNSELEEFNKGIVYVDFDFLKSKGSGSEYHRIRGLINSKLGNDTQVDGIVELEKIGKLSGDSLVIDDQRFSRIPIQIILKNEILEHNLKIEERLLLDYFVTKLVFSNCKIRSELQLGKQRHSNPKWTIIRFENGTEIKSLFYNRDPGSQSGNFHQIEFNESKIGLFEIEGYEWPFPTLEFSNFEVEAIVIKKALVKISNSIIGLFIIDEHQEARNRFSIERCIIKFPVKIARSFFGFNKDYLKGKFKNSDPILLSSIKFLSQNSFLESSLSELERIYTYFETRKSLLKSIFYFVNEYHYSILKPIIFAVISLIPVHILLNYEFNGFREGLGMWIIFSPNDFLKNILFSPVDLSIDTWIQIIVRLALSIFAVLTDYFVFSFALALKRRFGYRKPFS